MKYRDNTVDLSRMQSPLKVSYKRVWKLLIDRDMKKKDLCTKANISPASITKMGKDGHVTTQLLQKICTALNCDIGDIMEIVPRSHSQLRE